MKKITGLTLLSIAICTGAVLLSACDDTNNVNSGSYENREPYQVGTTTFDPNLPPEPQLPTAAQLCSTVYASDKYVSRPDGALPPEADPSPAGAQVAADPTVVNPDQARIQAALDACGAAVDLQVGAAIADADAAATAMQSADAGSGISGISGEELAKPLYQATQFAVRLAVSNTGPGNGFITGPLNLPSGVTLFIDKGVTVYATRDVMAFSANAAGPYCANTAVSSVKAGSSSNCTALITGTNIVNAAVMGDGAIDSRGYSEIVTSNKLYPLMKVDLTCSNTYADYSKATQAADDTPCDNGGTFVDSKSPARNMTWWDLAWLGNLVENGRTGFGSQSDFRMMVFNYVKNLTLYRITLNNSANFHVVPAGVDGLTVWSVKVQTPSNAAYANPAGNLNPLYTGDFFNEDNVKNTDAFDPAASSKATQVKLTTGSKTTSTGKVSFDGYLKNVVFAYNYISTGDDDIAVKGSNAPAGNGSDRFGVDGNRDVRSDRQYGLVIAHNHIYWGHGISIGSETNVGVANMHAYDNSFNGSEEALRIKSDYARGGEVAYIYYDKNCIQSADNSMHSLLYTPYYSTKALPSGGPLIPNFHDIFVSNTSILGPTAVVLQGFAADTEGLMNAQNPLTITLDNVVTDSPEQVNMISSDATVTVTGVNMPIFPSADSRTNVIGTPTQAIDASKVVDCSRAFVDFPSLTSPNGVTDW